MCPSNCARSDVEGSSKQGLFALSSSPSNIFLYVQLLCAIIKLIVCQYSAGFYGGCLPVQCWFLRGSSHATANFQSISLPLFLCTPAPHCNYVGSLLEKTASKQHLCTFKTPSVTADCASLLRCRSILGVRQLQGHWQEGAVPGQHRSGGSLEWVVMVCG